MSEAGKKVIFLDRDGTINIDHGYVHKVEDFEWIKGAREAMKQLQDAGFTLAIVTNQSGIGHGLYTTDHMDALHQHMMKGLKEFGIETPPIAFCHHHRDEGCDCRKPATGMKHMIENQIGTIDYPRSWAIGDKLSDVGFGHGVGAKTALIKSTYWKEEDITEQPDIIVDSLLEFAQHLVEKNITPKS